MTKIDKQPDGHPKRAHAHKAKAAAEPHHGHEVHHQKVDRESHWRRDFKHADDNHDHKLSRSELDLPKAERRLYDHNHNGVVGRREFHRGARIADRLDKNDDGRLSHKELHPNDHHHHDHPHASGHGGGHGGHDASGHGGGHGGHDASAHDDGHHAHAGHGGAQPSAHHGGGHAHGGPADASPGTVGDANSPDMAATQGPVKGATDFVISSFNVLGNSHTEAGGEKPGMGSGVSRVRNAAALLKQHNVDVVGFQEMQHPQMAEFKKVAPEYATYSTTKKHTVDTENSIAWRKDKFDLVKGSTLDIPYFGGHTRHIPVVLLRDKQTGQQMYVINTHNPADTKAHRNQEQYRDEATRREVALVNKLKATGIPVFVTGDMNERNEAADHFTHEAPLHAAMAGANGRLPSNTGIDWIFGTPDVSFSHYGRERGALEQRTSDHPMVYSHVRIDPHKGG